MIPTDDRQLIQSVIAHDPEASDIFVDRFSNFVWSILARDLGMAQELAEDIHQDIFLRLIEDNCRRLRNWSGDGSFVNYLGPIVRNLANDHFRKKKVRSEVPLDPREDEDDRLPFILVSSDPSPEEAAQAAERRHLLHQAVNTLSQRDQELIRCRHFKELSYRQIADEMGYKISSVGVILARAEKRLKKAVDRLLVENRLAPVDR